MAVTRGRIRGNGAQLASYLLRPGENDSIRVLDISGTSQPHDLRKSLLEMSLSSELSRRTTKGLYQVVINPAPAESYRMSDQDWIRAAEILEEHTGFCGQPRVMVLHEKDGRVHCHCVWQRWSHDRNRIIPNRFSRLKQNDARLQIEQELGLVRTQKRNLQTPERRQLVTELWQSCPSGKDFIRALEQHQFTVAWSDESHPLRLVSPDGVDSDLVRDISGARKKQVMERLDGIKLPDKKQAIKRIRQAQKSRHRETRRERIARELKEQLQRSPKRDRGR
ncbi:MAG TPA: relaxase [Puia sp.]